MSDNIIETSNWTITRYVGPAVLGEARQRYQITFQGVTFIDGITLEELRELVSATILIQHP
jgi:hypothetical protein